jgi:hypothetical protein
MMSAGKEAKDAAADVADRVTNNKMTNEAVDNAVAQLEAAVDKLSDILGISAKDPSAGAVVQMARNEDVRSQHSTHAEDLQNPLVKSCEHMKEGNSNPKDKSSLEGKATNKYEPNTNNSERLNARIESFSFANSYSSFSGIGTMREPRSRSLDASISPRGSSSGPLSTEGHQIFGGSSEDPNVRSSRQASMQNSTFSSIQTSRQASSFTSAEDFGEENKSVTPTSEDEKAEAPGATPET